MTVPPHANGIGVLFLFFCLFFSHETHAPLLQTLLLVNTQMMLLLVPLVLRHNRSVCFHLSEIRNILKVYCSPISHYLFLSSAFWKNL